MQRKLKSNLDVLMAKNGYRSFRKLSNDTKISYFRLRQFANQKNQTIDYEIVEILCEKFGCGVDDLFYFDKKAQ